MSDPLARQIHPLELNPKTGEPFLRLPAPHSDIIITPPRLSDAPSIVPILNDPAVYRWLISPPWPFLEEHAIGWLEMVKALNDHVWAEFQEAAANDAPPCITNAAPVRIIREVKPDGTEEYLGDCEFHRSTFAWIVDKDERAKLIAENEAYPAGDPKTIWSIGDYLKPSHHGKGIMSAVIRTLMNTWAIPRMGMRLCRPFVFDGNEGSLRVFEKYGFVRWKTVPNAIEVKAKGEFPAESRTIHLLDLPPST